MTTLKSTPEEIKHYCYMLFMMSDLDWNGYLALKQFEKKCLEKGEIILP
jgi:hypothetical protein